MPSSHLILCHPLLLLPPIRLSIRVFSNESTLHIRWPKYWSFSFSISPSNEHPGLISFRMDWLDLLAVQGTQGLFRFTQICMYMCIYIRSFPSGSAVKNPPANAGDMDSILELGRAPKEGNDNPPHYSFLGNPMDRGAWWATVHGVAKQSDTTWLLKCVCDTLSWYQKFDC